MPKLRRPIGNNERLLDRATLALAAAKAEADRLRAALARIEALCEQADEGEEARIDVDLIRGAMHMENV